MSARLMALLDGVVAPGVYRLRSRAAGAAVIRAAALRGWRTFHLDGRRVTSKREFLEACSAAMGFPGHFGLNWDALADMLRDLSWAPAAHGYLVLFDAAGRFASAEPAEYAVALDVLRRSVEAWQDTPTPMVVLLRCAGRAAPAGSWL